MGALEDKLQAIFDGMQQGASAGWADELAPEISGMLPGPKDPEGMTRNYAAGSAESDMRNNMRAKSADLESRFPKSYSSGKALAALPAMTASAGVGGVAGAGLMGGLRGGLSGAGNADEGARMQGAARGAAPEAAASMAGAALPQLLGKVGDLIKGGGGPGGPSGLAPAYAGAGAGMGATAAEDLPMINQMATVPPPRGRAGGMGGGRSGLSAADERLTEQDRQQWEMEHPEAAAQEENTSVRPALRPRAPESPEQAYVPPIPKAKTGVPSLQRGFEDLIAQDAELGKEAAAEPARIELMKKIDGIRKVPRDMTNYADPMQSRAALENMPDWREMNEFIHKRPIEPLPRNSPAWKPLPAPGRVPDVSKIEEDFANHGGAVEKTTVKPNGVERETVRVKPGKVEESEDDIKTLFGTAPR